MTSYGNCEKHPNFPFTNCPACESEDASQMIDKEIIAIENRIVAGKEVIRASKEQLKILRSRKNELENLKQKIQTP